MGFRCEPVLQHNVVHAPWSVAAGGCRTVAPRDVGRSPFVVADPGNTSQPSPASQLSVKSAIPAAGCAPGDDAAHYRPILVDSIVSYGTRVGERFPIVKGIGMGVKKIVGCRNGFIPCW